MTARCSSLTSRAASLSLPLVVGKGADTQARDFLALLARSPQIIR